MPIYKDVTRSDMPKYLHAIEDMMADCSKFFSFWFLFQIVVSICEYCLCYSYFQLNEELAELNSDKVSIGHVYTYLRGIRPDADYHTACNALILTRHSIAHLSSEYFTKAKVRALFAMDSFYDFLTVFGFFIADIVILKNLGATAQCDLTENTPSPMTF